MLGRELPPHQEKVIGEEAKDRKSPVSPQRVLCLQKAGQAGSGLPFPLCPIPALPQPAATKDLGMSQPSPTRLQTDYRPRSPSLGPRKPLWLGRGTQAPTPQLPMRLGTHSVPSIERSQSTSVWKLTVPSACPQLWQGGGRCQGPAQDGDSGSHFQSSSCAWTHALA